MPAARIGTSLRVVYGGVAMVVPANQAKQLLAVPGVVAVQEDALNKKLTDSSPEFVDAPPVWQSLGGQSTAGSGVLFADLDSGVWPEHPSFDGNPDLPAAPERPAGRWTMWLVFAAIMAVVCAASWFLGSVDRRLPPRDWLPPLAAGIGMASSSLFVVLNAQRLQRG